MFWKSLEPIKIGKPLSLALKKNHHINEPIKIGKPLSLSLKKNHHINDYYNH